MITLIKTFAFLLVLSCFSVEAISESPIRIQVKSAEPWAFFNVGKGTEKTKDLVGIWIEIIEEMEKISGLKMEISLGPHARMVQNLENGKTDMGFLVLSGHKSPHLIDVSYMFTVSTIALSLPGANIKQYDDFYGKRIGVVRGSTNDPKLDSDSSLFKQPFRSQEIIVNMLFQNRLDAIIGDNISLVYLIRKAGFGNIHYMTYKLVDSKVWICFSKFSPLLNQSGLIKQTNARLKSSGMYKAILDKYLNYPMSKDLH